MFRPQEDLQNLGWFKVPGVEDILVSKSGRILNLVTKHITKGSFVGHYLRYRYKGINYYVHRLIAAAFYGIPKDKNFIANHKDGNKMNNSFENIEWIPQQENVMHAYKNGLYKNKGSSRSHESLEERIFLFGYDDIFHPSTVTTIVGEDYEVEPNTLYNHGRNWDMSSEAYFSDLDQRLRIAFLNIVSAPDAEVPGLLLEVSMEQLNAFKEMYMDRDLRDVSKNISHSELEVPHKVFAFSKPFKLIDRSAEGILISQNYIRAVNETYRGFSEEFYKQNVETLSDIPFRKTNSQYYIVNY